MWGGDAITQHRPNFFVNLAGCHCLAPHPGFRAASGLGQDSSVVFLLHTESRRECVVRPSSCSKQGPHLFTAPLLGRNHWGSGHRALTSMGTYGFCMPLPHSQWMWFTGEGRDGWSTSRVDAWSRWSQSLSPPGFSWCLSLEPPIISRGRRLPVSEADPRKAELEREREKSSPCGNFKTWIQYLWSSILALLMEDDKFSFLLQIVERGFCPCSWTSTDYNNWIITLLWPLNFVNIWFMLLSTWNTYPRSCGLLNALTKELTPLTHWSSSPWHRTSPPGKSDHKPPFTQISHSTPPTITFLQSHSVRPLFSFVFSFPLYFLN